ncbi:MAG: DUF6298 domain-containing protein [Nitrospirales bacterium]
MKNERSLDDHVTLAAFQSLSHSLKLPGRLIVHPTNPAYFQDISTGKAVFLHGYDHFRSRQEFDNNGIPPLDFDAFIAQLKHFNHNFLRLWAWEHFWRKAEGHKGRAEGQESVTLSPHVYQRTGPGTAIDGQPKFDLHAFDQKYFDRLRHRVMTAGESGIWVSVMLFQGWSIHGSGTHENSQWEGHPLNKQNNINGIDGDYDRDGRGWEVHTRINAKVNAIHDAYAKKVIDTVGDLDNVLYEISNETKATAATGACHHVAHVRDWAYHLINLIHRYEQQRGYGSHPVGISSFRPFPDDPMSVDWNLYLFDSPADYVSPNGTRWTGNEDWKKDPPAAPVGKVVIADTDHIHPNKHGGPGMRSWQWRTFTRGHSLNAVEGDPEQGADWVTLDDSATMQAMGRYVEMADLARMKPCNVLSTTTYCLGDPGHTYIVYQPSKGLVGSSQGFPFELDLQSGTFRYEWFNPETNQISQTGELQWDSGISTFTPPFNDHAVLFLKRQRSEEKEKPAKSQVEPL